MTTSRQPDQKTLHETHPHVRRNILKLYLFSAFEMMNFAVPILLPFYISIGLAPGVIFAVAALFVGVAALFEVPSGYLADMMGRRNTLILSGIVSITGVLTYANSDGLIGVVIAESLLGIGLSLRSGVREAVIYDSLILTEETHEFQKHEGTAGGIGLAAEGVSCVAGGLLAVVSLRLPFYMTAIASFIALLIILTFREPERELPKRNHLENLKKVFYTIWWKDPRLFWLTLLSGVICATTFAAIWFSQVYFESIHLGLAWFGIIFAIGSFVAAFGNYISHHLRGRFSERSQFIFIIAIVLVGFLGMIFIDSIWGLLFTLLPRLAWGLVGPLSLEMTNRMIKSDLRVTILSVKSMIQSFIFMVIGPIYGYLINKVSFSFATLISAGMLFIFGLFFLARAIKAGSFRQ